MNRLLLFCLCCCPAWLLAQASTADCLGAIPICQRVYVETNSPSGGGDVLEINPSLNCMRVETNSVWYSFTVNNSGDFGFLLTPNNPSDDYDWALFDITNATCDDLFDNPDLIVSCNAAGNDPCAGPTGANGGSSYNNQGFGCDLPPTTLQGFSPFNALIPVQEGNTYVLCVSNFFDTPDGYTIDFGLSTGIDIFDTTPPFVEAVVWPEECFEGTITILFSEPIQCATISENNFFLQTPDWPGTYDLSLSSPSCDAGGNFSKVFQLETDPVGLFGLSDYSLQLIPNATFPVLDLCDNAASTSNFSYLAPFSTDVNLGPDGFFCEGQGLTLDATTPESSYLWQDGSSNSTFVVDEPGTYAVTVNSSCGVFTDTIELFPLDELAAIDFGPDQSLCPGEILLLDVTTPEVSYLWQDGSTDATFLVEEPGIYSVTVSSNCESRSDTIVVDYFAPVAASIDQIGVCAGFTLQLDVSTPDATYEWQDGSTAPDFEVFLPGDYAVTITTPCETQVLATTVQSVNTAPTVDLGDDAFLCANDSLVVELSNEAAFYLWQDGSTDSTFTVNSPGSYAVTITNACGTVSDNVTIDFGIPINLSLPLDTFLCPGEQLAFNVTDAATEQYQWSDNSSTPLFQITEPGAYSVTLSNTCEQVSASMNVRWCEQCELYFPNAFSPNDDGFNDFFLPLSDCPFSEYSLRIFDRWGALVYDSAMPDEGWNGKVKQTSAPTGVYVWVVDLVIFEEGVPRRIQESGDVVLMR
ncbi:MAG: gliding motility-associated C-terminal domain-containing protein [Bacteroidota bacterium]